MVIHTTKNSLIKALSTKRIAALQANKSLSVGFVPTMGALHHGHLTLVQKALEENDLVVVSIFVNPTQFNNSIDLEKYPRNPEKDMAELEKIHGEIIVFLPEVSDLYGTIASSEEYDFNGLDQVMEGQHREGHFNGVGTILNKFFRIIKPEKAYFGEKDYQQLQIVRRLVEIEKLPIQIIGCPILRENNGLAMSSRNERLSAAQFNEAAIIHKTLTEVREKFPTHSIAQLHEFVAERFLLIPGIELEYFEIVNEATLTSINEKIPSVHYRAFIAAFVGEVRLIDNISLN